MADILGIDVPISLPSAGFGFGTSFWFVIMLMVVSVILGIIGLVLISRYKVYNRKVVVFENVANSGYQPTFKDRARIIKLGDGGEELLYLLKKKVYRTAYGKKMGKNAYWFAVGQDGYWYNFVLGDLDAKMGMLDIEPIDRDMRYMHVAIRKNIQDRYKKENWFEKNAVYIMSGFFLLIMLIGLWFLLDKIADISATSASSVGAAQKVTEATENLISTLDNLYSNSGIRPSGVGG